MKTVQVKKQSKTSIAIQVNLNSEKSIKASEKKISELINAGYNLENQHGGFRVWNFIYSLKH